MVHTAQWSYLKDLISQGPLLYIHRKGRPWLFLGLKYFFASGVSWAHVRTIVQKSVCFYDAPLLARYLFWTEWGQNPCIGRSRLDGSDQVTLVNSGIMWPNGISIDYEVQLHTDARTLSPTSLHCHILYYQPRLISGCDMTLPKRFGLWYGF